MGRPEDKYVKLPAIIHATRIGYRYRSIKSDASGIDYAADMNIFFEPFRAVLERINGKPVDADKAHYLVSQLKLKLSGNDLGRAFFACLHSSIEATASSTSKIPLIMTSLWLPSCPMLMGRIVSDPTSRSW